jgi:hypothetical protein
MTTKITLVIAILVSTISFSQPAIEWQKSLGGSDADLGHSIKQTLDGGYIIIGGSSSSDGDISGGYPWWDVWLVKLNSSGILEWEKSLGGTGADTGHSIDLTSDGGYIVAGKSASNDGDVSGNQGELDYWIVKLSSTGDIEWEKTYGGTNSDVPYSVVQASDGGYIVAGWTRSFNGDITVNQGKSDYWIIKLSSIGDLEWQKTYGGSEIDFGYSIINTSDGGFMVSGSSESMDGDVTTNYGNADCWILKLSSLGIIEWEKTLGGSGSEYYFTTVRQTTDGGFILGGSSSSNDFDVSGNHGASDVWVAKLDSTGNIEWENSLGGSNVDYCASIQQTSDGGYVTTGFSFSNDGDTTFNNGLEDYWVVKLSALGSMEWEKSLGGSSQDSAISIQQTSDGGYVTIGSTKSNDGDVTGHHGDWDYWIVKLGSDLGVDVNELNNFAVLSPNPNKGKFNLSFSEEVIVTSVKVINVLGKTVYTETNIPRRTLEIDQNFAPGVYFVNVTSIASEAILKMIVD